MDNIKKWFKEAEVAGVRIFSYEGYDYLIYKGFKITKFNTGDCIIQDVRLSDLYNEVREDHLIVLDRMGFITGADYIAYDRNVMRMKESTAKLEKLFTELEGLKSAGTDTKKVENCNENILKYTDLTIFYRIKIDQHLRKYKNS